MQGKKEMHGRGFSDQQRGLKEKEKTESEQNKRRGRHVSKLRIHSGEEGGTAEAKGIPGKNSSATRTGGEFAVKKRRRLHAEKPEDRKDGSPQKYGEPGEKEKFRAWTGDPGTLRGWMRI